MADQLVRSRTFYQASGTTLAGTFTESTALDNTHLLVAAVNLSNSTTIATPSGWTAVSGSGSSGSNQTRMFVKQGDGTTNGISMTVTSAQATLTLMAFSGYASLTPLYSAGSNGTSLTTTSVSLSSGYGVGVALAVVGVVGAVTWGSWAAPAVRNGSIVNAAQRMDSGRAEYLNESISSSISWTTARNTRSLLAILPLLRAPTVTTTSLNAMSQGTAFSQTLASAANPAPTWAVTAGTLPTGLSLSSAGVLSGTPSASGAYNFTVTATNSQGTGTQAYTGTVSGVSLPTPRGAWNFDEQAGTIAFDTINQFDATVTGTWTSSGRTNGAVTSISSNSAAVVDSGVMTTTNAVTWMAWMNLKPSSGQKDVLVVSDSNAGNSGQWSAGLEWANSSTFGVWSHNVSTSSTLNFHAPTAPTTGTWTHMAITVTSSSVKFYMNGTLVASGSHTLSVSSSRYIEVGGVSLWSSNDGGSVDDMRIFDQELSASQISSFMNTPVASPARTVAYYDTNNWGDPGTDPGNTNTSYKDIVIPRCRTGDLIVIFGLAENYTRSDGTRVIQDISPGGAKTGSWVYTTGLNPVLTSNSEAYGGHGLVTSSGSISMRVFLRCYGGERMGVGAYVFPASMVSANRGFAAYANDSYDGLISTTLSANSVVAYAGVSWQATDLGTTPTPTGATVYRSLQIPGTYSVWSALWSGRAAGTTSYGPAGQSNVKVSGFAFVMDTVSAPSFVPRWFTGAGVGLQSYTLTGSGLIEVL